MRLCRNGLHPKPGAGRCVPCRKASQARYNASQKGRALHARYNGTSKGMLRNVRYEALRRGQ